jgi:thioredoxin-related protein
MVRQIIFAAAALLCLASAAPATEVGDDGLHKQPWFTLTFRDVAEDIEAARADGKRLALVFEQRGCIYCRQMHEEILADPAIADYIAANFHVVQYNLFGDEEVTDLDGTTLSEKGAARRWRVVFTPTILFMPETAPEDGTVGDAAVATMPGAFGKQTFLHMFQWVRENGYQGDEHFQSYHARKLAESGATSETTR